MVIATETLSKRLMLISGTILKNKFGAGLEDKVVARAFARSLEKAAIERHYTLHHLRSTHATMCAEAELPSKVTQERLGHKDPAITAKYYTHVTDRMKRQSVKKLNSFRKNRAMGAEKGADSNLSADN